MNNSLTTAEKIDMELEALSDRGVWYSASAREALLRSRKRRAIKKARLQTERFAVYHRRHPARCCVLGWGHARGSHVYRDDGDPMDYTHAALALRHFCLELPDCPLPDQLLAQKLMIEADEGEFLAQAREWGAGATAGRAEFNVEFRADTSWGWRAPTANLPRGRDRPLATVPTIS